MQAGAPPAPPALQPSKSAAEEAKAELEVADDYTRAWVAKGRRAMLASMGIREIDGAGAIASLLRGGDKLRERMNAMLGGPPGVVFVAPRLLVNTPKFWLHATSAIRPGRGGEPPVSGIVNPAVAARHARASINTASAPEVAASARAAGRKPGGQPGASPRSSIAGAAGTVPATLPPETFSVKRYATNTNFLPMDQVAAWRRILVTPHRDRTAADIATLDSGCLSRVPGFTDVAPALRLFMLRFASYTHLPAGDVLFHQNDPADW
jgi:hypothetical protein